MGSDELLLTKVGLFAGCIYLQSLWPFLVYVLALLICDRVDKYLATLNSLDKIEIDQIKSDITNLKLERGLKSYR